MGCEGGDYLLGVFCCWGLVLSVFLLRLGFNLRSAPAGPTPLIKESSQNCPKLRPQSPERFTPSGGGIRGILPELC